MNKLDQATGGIFFGFILFMTCFCAGWWTGLGLGDHALTGCIAGAVAGVVINLLFLRKIVAKMFSLHPLLLAGVFVLYSVGIFGFFMGVPVFNMLPGIAAAWYVGRKARAAGTLRPHGWRCGTARLPPTSRGCSASDFLSQTA